MPNRFGRYELRHLIGRGGMGEVHLAYDTERDREVALKLLSAHLASDESFQARFRRESRIAARLSDPHIIPIHDFGEIDGRLFIDMRMVRGQDLSDLLAQRGALPPELAIAILGQVASALDAAHESDLVHRDVKPSNVLLTGMPERPTAGAGDGADGADETPFAYLVDFGIARSTSGDGTQLTSTTTTLGTAAYLAPERIAGNVGDRRVDVYALACVLFETLTGRKPWDGELFAIMYGHVNDPPPSLAREVQGLPPGLDGVVRRGMAKDPAQRYATAGDLMRDARAALRSAAVPLAPPPVRPLTMPPPAAAPQGPPRTPGPPHGFPHGAPQEPPRQPPPGPVRPAVASQPLSRPPTGPVEQQARPGQSWVVILAVVVIVLAAAGVGAFFALRGTGSPSASGGSGSAGTTAAGPSSGSSGSGGAAPTLHAGTGSAVTWADYSSFSRLVGTSDGDTAHAYRNATCRLRAAGSDDPAGVISAVGCTVAQTSVAVTVERFATNAAAFAYLRGRQGAGYGVVGWGAGSTARGLVYSSSGRRDIVTTVCALPAYVVRFTDDDPDVTLSTLRSLYWAAAVFPDVTPAGCSDSFDGASTDDTSPGSAAKPTVVLDADAVSALLRRGRTGLTVSSVVAGNGADVIAFDQRGAVSFYRNSAAGLVRAGTSWYPYDSSLGTGPDATVSAAAVLTGMPRATFVVTGTFTTDSSGNAVAFAYSPDAGWGVIKAESDGNLAPSGEPVGDDRIGLAQGFDLSAGELVTSDCSRDLPVSQCGTKANRVIKYWKWTGSEFVLVRREGRER